MWSELSTSSTPTSSTPTSSNPPVNEWFSFLERPWNKMWIDDFYWLPYVLQGKVFRARFLFRGHDQIISHIIKEVESSLEEEWCKEQLSLITIERDALPQKSIDIDFGIK